MPTPVTPLVTVDIIIQMIDREFQPIVLIERKHPPYGWAIPGGFVDVGETLEQAAIREAKEETCLQVELKCLLGNYSNPARDSRNHTVSAVYVAEARGNPQAADDAAHLQLYSPQQLPTSLAFDHDLILMDFLNYLRLGEVAPLR